MIEYVFPKNGAQHNGEQDRSARRARAQPQERRRRHSAEWNRRRGGRLRVRQIVARARRPLHRGLAALFGGALDLHSTSAHAGAEGRRRRGAPCARSPRAPSEAGRPEHLRNGDRTAQYDSTHVFAPCDPQVPERPHGRAYARRRGRKVARLSGLRGEVLCAGCGGSGLQQRRRLQDLRRNGHGEVGQRSFPTRRFRSTKAP